jgi:hypothetical protein
MARVLETDLREALAGLAEREVDLWPLVEEDLNGEVMADTASDGVREASNQK